MNRKKFQQLLNPANPHGEKNKLGLYSCFYFWKSSTLNIPALILCVRILMMFSKTSRFVSHLIASQDSNKPMARCAVVQENKRDAITS